MLEFARRFWQWLVSFFYDLVLELTFVGLENSGKTTLTNVISGAGFYEDSIPTVGFNRRKVKKYGVTFTFWDVGGQSRYRGMWNRYLKNVDVICFVVDLSDRAKFEEAKREFNEIASNPQIQECPLLLLGNKSDLGNAASIEEFRDFFAVQGLLETRKFNCMTVSAKTMNNLGSVLDWIKKQGQSVKREETL